LDSGRPKGFLLTFAVTVAALCVWAFGGLTQDVVAHDEVARIDPRFEHFVAAHRAAWATGLMKSVTWLGSTVVLIPIVLLVGSYFVVRRRDWKPLGKLGASLLGGAAVRHRQAACGPGPAARSLRRRVPILGVRLPLGSRHPEPGRLGDARPPRRRDDAWASIRAVRGRHPVVGLVGGSRIYLGAHWLSDVLGGYALSGLWLSVLVAVMLARARSPDRDVGIAEIVERAA